MSAVIENHHDDHDHGLTKGWVGTNDEIRTLVPHLWFSFAMFLWADVWPCHPSGVCQITAVAPEFFNQMTTMHGLIMVFGAVMPAFRPCQLAGTDDDWRAGLRCPDEQLQLRILPFAGNAH